MDSLNIDQIATILDALGGVLGKSPAHSLAIAGAVLAAIGAVLHRVRALRAPVADARAVEVEQAVAGKLDGQAPEAAQKMAEKAAPAVAPTLDSLLK